MERNNHGTKHIPCMNCSRVALTATSSSLGPKPHLQSSLVKLGGERRNCGVPQEDGVEKMREDQSAECLANHAKIDCCLLRLNSCVLDDFCEQFNGEDGGTTGRKGHCWHIKAAAEGLRWSGEEQR